MKLHVLNWNLQIGGIKPNTFLSMGWMFTEQNTLANSWELNILLYLGPLAQKLGKLSTGEIIYPLNIWDQHNCLVQLGKGREHEAYSKKSTTVKGSRKQDEIILFPNSFKVTIHSSLSKHVTPIFPSTCLAKPVLASYFYLQKSCYRSWVCSKQVCRSEIIN